MSFVSRITHWWPGTAGPKNRSARRPRPDTLALARRRLQLEHLEQRTVLSVTPLGGEFQLNTTTMGTQGLNDLGSVTGAIDDQGRSVAIWSSQLTPTSPLLTYGQRFDAQGARDGGEFLVDNPAPGQSTYFATVTKAPGGEFAVTWAEGVIELSDTSILIDTRVFVRLFDASGTPLGNPIAIDAEQNIASQVVAGAQFDADGNLLVIWSAGEVTATAINLDLYTRRFDANGTPLGPTTPINLGGARPGFFAAVGLEPNGNLMLAWSTAKPDDATKQIIVGQQVGTDGNPVGERFVIASENVTYYGRATLAMDRDGDFVVVWSGDYQVGNTTNEETVARQYDHSGTPIGPQFLLSQDISVRNRHPSVAIDGAGTFLAAWNDYQPSYSDIYATRYSLAGQAEDASPARVNAPGNHTRFNPSVSVNHAGDALIVWASQGQDGDGWGVFGRLLARPNHAPSANAGGPYHVTVGGWLTLNASGSSDFDGNPLTYSWDVNGDGVFGDATGLSPTLSWPQLGALGIQAAGQGFSVRVRVSDSGGLLADSLPVPLTIAAPALVGDANHDGSVGAADYAVWASQFGQVGLGLAADFDGNGSVGLADYTLWAANFGATVAGGAQSPRPSAGEAAIALPLTKSAKVFQTCAVNRSPAPAETSVTSITNGQRADHAATPPTRLWSRTWRGQSHG